MHSEPSRTSNIELLAKIVWLLAANYFRKKLHLRCASWFWMRLWMNKKTMEYICIQLQWIDFFKILENDRSSFPDVFLRKDVLKRCSKFIWEHQCRSVISRKLLWNFTEITLRDGCSPVNFRHIFRTPFYKNTNGGLLLQWVRTDTRSNQVSYFIKYFAEDMGIFNPNLGELFKGSFWGGGGRVTSVSKTR